MQHTSLEFHEANLFIIFKIIFQVNKSCSRSILQIILHFSKRILFMTIVSFLYYRRIRNVFGLTFSRHFMLWTHSSILYTTKTSRYRNLCFKIPMRSMELSEKKNASLMPATHIQENQCKYTNQSHTSAHIWTLFIKERIQQR